MIMYADLDECMARAVDELLTLTSQAAIGGRPELALCANAALDELLGYLLQARPAAEADPMMSYPYGERSHAQH
jgi:hypothetical protein